MIAVVLATTACSVGCGQHVDPDAGPSLDAGRDSDAGPSLDAGRLDGGFRDGGTSDGGGWTDANTVADAGLIGDAAAADAGAMVDGGTFLDAGRDWDAGPSLDAGRLDGGFRDGGASDGGGWTDANTIADAGLIGDGAAADGGAVMDGATPMPDGAACVAAAAPDAGVAWVDCGGGEVCPNLPTLTACASAVPIPLSCAIGITGSAEYQAFTFHSLSAAVDSYASPASVPCEPEMWFELDLAPHPPPEGECCSEDYTVILSAMYEPPDPRPDPLVTIYDRCSGAEIIHYRASSVVGVRLPPGSYVVMVEVNAPTGGLYFDVQAFGPTPYSWPTCT